MFWFLHLTCIGPFPFCHASSWFLFGLRMFLFWLIIIQGLFSVQLQLILIWLRLNIFMQLVFLENDDQLG